ncbi:P1 family peptidase, partial [Calidithermus terrae]|uniref:P1 family peptidase n=1 Tax=Calidithermus terrae TaxID=1408545 RepID=UPI00159C51B2
MKPGPFNAITDVPGVKVGHYTDALHLTGTTVVLVEGGAVAGVDVRGSAPGTRETDLLHPANLVEQVQAVVLSGGSAYGLETVGGVLRYLEERGLGYPVGEHAVVPIVPAAVLFDLGVGSHTVRPGLEQGYQAAAQALEDAYAETLEIVRGLPQDFLARKVGVVRVQLAAAADPFH